MKTKTKSKMDNQINRMSSKITNREQNKNRMIRMIRMDSNNRMKNSNNNSNSNRMNSNSNRMRVVVVMINL